MDRHDHGAGGRLHDLVPLATRLGVLVGVRAVLVVAALAAAELGPLPDDADPARLQDVTAWYVVAMVALEAIRRVAPRATLPLVGVGLLADGMYLVAAATLTGGLAGPLSWLLPVHLVAVTLLASHRTGLKLALWDSLLVEAAFFAEQAALVDVAPLGREERLPAIVGFWLVALVTAGGQALNERELRRSRAGVHALAEMGRRLQEAGQTDEVLDVLLYAVQRHTGYRRAAVLVEQADGARLRTLAAGAVGDAELGVRHAELDLGHADGAVRRCWQQREPELVARPRPADDGVLERMLPDARNVIVVPLPLDRARLAVLAVERGGRRRARVPASTVALLGQFAADAALAYRNVVLLGELQQQAAMDGLTELPNRRMFHDALEREVQRSRRTGQPLSLVLLDVDHFKQVNDTHGHQVGDAVLCAVAAALQRRARGSDLPTRYGGEEFAVLLPACDARHARKIAERLRAGVAVADSPVHVTASAGVATHPDDAATPETLIAAADAALYRAKQAGRDRTVQAVDHSAGQARDDDVVSAGGDGVAPARPSA